MVSRTFSLDVSFDTDLFWVPYHRAPSSDARGFTDIVLRGHMTTHANFVFSTHETSRVLLFGSIGLWQCSVLLDLSESR
jgi:hypothetical protein